MVLSRRRHRRSRGQQDGRRHGGQVRPRRHPGEQRRQPRRSAVPRDDLQAVARHPRRHPRRRVPVLARGAAAHGQEQVRAHHQYGRRVEPPRRTRPRPCRRRQGRHRRLHPRAGVGIRAARRHGELHRARPHRRPALGDVRAGHRAQAAGRPRRHVRRRVVAGAAACASRTTATSPARPSM